MLPQPAQYLEETGDAGRKSDVSKRSYDAQEVPVALTETTLPDFKEFDSAEASKLLPPLTLSAEDEKKLYRRIDLRIMPILTLMYVCSFLDRGPSLFSSTMLCEADHMFQEISVNTFLVGTRP